jgi:hypothetical protein
MLVPAGHAQVAPNRGPMQPVPSTPSIKLTMDDQHVLKENLLKNAQSEGSAGQAEIERGKEVPASIQLHRFPDDIAGKIPQIKAHQYFIADNSIVVVETTKRTIVEVIK